MSELEEPINPPRRRGRPAKKKVVEETLEIVPSEITPEDSESKTPKKKKTVSRRTKKTEVDVATVKPSKEEPQEKPQTIESDPKPMTVQTQEVPAELSKKEPQEEVLKESPKERNQQNQNNPNQRHHHKNHGNNRNRGDNRGDQRHNKNQKNQRQNNNSNQQNQHNKNRNNRGHQRHNYRQNSGFVLGNLPQYDIWKNTEALNAILDPLKDVTESLDFNELYTLSLNELVERARSLDINVEGAPQRVKLVTLILRSVFKSSVPIHITGVLKLLSENNGGVLVYESDDYQVKPLSTYIPQSLIRRLGLKKGHIVEVLAHPPREDFQESCPFVLCVKTVMGMSPEEVANLTPFNDLVPYYPTKRLLLETSDEVNKQNLSMRIVDLLTPVGLGQRGLIVAPPRTGKTVLLQSVANAIVENNKDVHLIVLLIDERPEEVTDFKRHVKAEVISSTFDQTAESHIEVAEMVINKSRRMVEAGKDVVILLDSITRLARAYNAMVPSTGKILSGGVEAGALQKPKFIFGSARNIEGGGSLTILGSALVETGSRMDEVIFEEFKGTGNMELHLDRALVDKRIFPAINIEKSGTRKEEILYHPDEMAKIYAMRRAMKGAPSTDSMEMLIQRVRKTPSNAAFLMGMNR